MITTHLDLGNDIRVAVAKGTVATSELAGCVVIDITASGLAPPRVLHATPMLRSAARRVASTPQDGWLWLEPSYSKVFDAEAYTVLTTARAAAEMALQGTPVVIFTTELKGCAAVFLAVMADEMLKDGNDPIGRIRALLLDDDAVQTTPQRDMVYNLTGVPEAKRTEVPSLAAKVVQATPAQEPSVAFNAMIAAAAAAPSTQKPSKKERRAAARERQRLLYRCDKCTATANGNQLYRSGTLTLACTCGGTMQQTEAKR